MIQTLIVVLIVLAAVAFLGARGYRTLAAARRKDEGGCGGSCCSGS